MSDTRSLLDRVLSEIAARRRQDRLDRGGGSHAAERRRHDRGQCGLDLGAGRTRLPSSRRRHRGWVHPIIFSDNVTVEHEIIIKRMATEAGLLAMGPDCGTVILAGVGLGFANVVSPGPDRAGFGLGYRRPAGVRSLRSRRSRCSPCLGSGRRDLGDEVGGLSALAAIRLLDDDPAVEIIGVIAKQIGSQTRPAIDELLAEIRTPAVMVPGDDLIAGTKALLSGLAIEMPLSRPGRQSGSGPAAPATSSGSTAGARWPAKRADGLRSRSGGRHHRSWSRRVHPRTAPPYDRLPTPTRTLGRRRLRPHGRSHPARRCPRPWFESRPCGRTGTRHRRDRTAGVRRPDRHRGRPAGPRPSGRGAGRRGGHRLRIERRRGWPPRVQS